ncbi:MAG: putative toxin-antitoxin system toxin component, PIN family [Syntrophaceae bacterium]|nr:putative toxin-antitoxin system toxin component, PIN family [Syntrophaceae bacterium]
MGKGQKGTRVVLDTNVLVSALILGGRLAAIVDLWKAGAIIPVLSRETFEEFGRVLRYPRFKMTDEDIRAIVEKEVLPYFEVVEPREAQTGLSADPEDDKFFSCALAGRCEFLVSGDRHILAIKRHGSVRVITPKQLLERFLP